MPVLVGMSGAYALGDAEDVHHPLVAPARARLLVQARHRLGIVIVDLGPRVEHGADGVLVALKVGDQHFHRAGRHALVDLPDRLVRR